MSAKTNSINFLKELSTKLQSILPADLETASLLAKLQQATLDMEQAQENDFRNIADCLYDGIYITDGSGKTTYVNDAYTRITGIKSEEVIGKYVSDLQAKGLYKNAISPEVIRTRQQVNAVAESLRNGRKMLITGKPIFDSNGEISRVVVIDRDITDLQKMQSELEKTKEKMQTAAASTHKKDLELSLLRKQQLDVNIICQSPEMNQILKMIEQVAAFDTTVLITGETGTGKEVIANEIHMRSNRHNRPFIKINCAAIPASLLESELFGYEKGAFTGANTSGKMGMFELANHGTLLLDEVGDMPMDLQPKLLRALQQKEVIRIGGAKPIKLDVRVIASTNCDLKELVAVGKFREDLYYRLSVFPLHILPLRNRTSDIPPLVKHFLREYNLKYSKEVNLDKDCLETMRHYSWPGNIRELRNIIERLVIISEPHTVLDAPYMAEFLRLDNSREVFNQDLGLKEIIAVLEKRIIEKALLSCGNTRAAAKKLKIDQSTVVKKAQKLGIKIHR